MGASEQVSQGGVPPAGTPQQTPKRPDWMRPAFTPPDMFIRKGMIPMRRIKDWPREVKTVPEELVVDVKATSLGLRVGNVLPSGFASLFAICVLPSGLAIGTFLAKVTIVVAQTEALWMGIFGAVVLTAGCAVILAFCYFVYQADWHGGIGDIRTVFDRKHRKVYQRVARKLAKGEWDWDKLVPYAEERNRISAINQALTFVEFDETTGEPISFITAEVAGLHAEPLADTYAFLREFMENGVTKLPAPITLSAVPLPGWYAFTPPWFFGLPRTWAKCIWASVFALFVWPVVTWSRVIRRFQPYNHWPAERVAQWQADAADATPEEKQWIASNVKPPPKVPLAARIGFALAVIVSSPVWWSILTGYVAGLAKFVK